MNKKSFQLGICFSVMVALTAPGCQSTGRSRVTATAPEPAADTLDEDLTAGQVADIQTSLARTMEQRGDLKAARAAYGRVLERDPANSTAAWRMAVVTDRQGHFDKSEPLYQRALKAEPKNAAVLCDYGYSLYLQRRWSESEQALKQAAELAPDDARIQNNLGLLYANTERSREAVLAFQRAGCTAEQTRTNIAVAAAMNGRTQEARWMFERVLEDNPESPTANRGLQALAAVTETDAGVRQVGYESETSESGRD
jgi:Tfp pilus assembly protein PilF